MINNMNEVIRLSIVHNLILWTCTRGYLKIYWKIETTRMD